VPILTVRSANRAVSGQRLGRFRPLHDAKRSSAAVFETTASAGSG
jgi:hypothetical protein